VPELRKERRGAWICYVCHKQDYAVIKFSGSGLPSDLVEAVQEFICVDCLGNMIAAGTLEVVLPGTTTASPTVSGDSVTLPVVQHDDGSVKVGEIEVRWD